MALNKELSKNKKTEYLVHFYNRITGLEVDSIDEMPADVLCFLSSYTYLELCTPFIIEDLIKNPDKSLPQCQVKYQIRSFSWLRRIAERIGKYKPYNRKSC